VYDGQGIAIPFELTIFYTSGKYIGYAIKSFQLQGTQTELDTANNAEPELTNAAIVTFKTLRDARIASQVLWQAKPYNTFVESAPEPKDIIWANLTNSVLNKYVIVSLIFLSCNEL
jgi:hypothetical protein